MTAEVLFGHPTAAEVGHGSLSDRFVVPPFSVLDTRQGYWQERKRAWLGLGIRGEVGREMQPGRGNYRSDGGLFGTAGKPGLMQKGLASQRAADTRTDQELMGAGAGSDGTSIFDPVLCELAYRWWCPEGGAVLDPFAGGSVRGVVASRLGHPYLGIDLSARQVEANREQANAIAVEPMPEWVVGDSRAVLSQPGPWADLVFTCPPYGDLEVYSDDPADLSTMAWPEFVASYEAIVGLACRRLRPGRFAVIVVSEIRAADGTYRGLVPATIHAFIRAGLRFYNECILVNSAGSLPLRVGKYMDAGRKVGRAHQNVLVFAKGEPERGWSYEREAPPDPQLALFP